MPSDKVPKLRIVQVVSSFGLGGAERVAFNIAKNLSARHEMSVFAVWPPASGQESIAAESRRELERSGVTCVDAQRSGRLQLFYRGFALSRYLRFHKIDLLHSHTDVPDFCVAIASYFVRRPTVRTIHNTQIWPTHSASGYFSERRFLTDAVVCIGADTVKAYKDLRARFSLPLSNDICIVPNGVDILPRAEWLSRRDLVRFLGGNETLLQIGFVGRLEPQKGPDILIDAVKQLSCASQAKAQFHIIGDGSQRAMLESIVVAHHLPVVFHGTKPLANRLISGFDLIVMPSRFEGLPLVALESRVVQTPVVFSRVEGLREVIPENWPLTFGDDDSKALSQLLAQCIGNPQILADVAAQYPRDLPASTDDMARAYERLYLEKVGQKS